MKFRLWPRSLQGQILLTAALALLLAQAIGAALLYRAQAERREEALVHAAAFRLYGALRRGEPPAPTHISPREFRGPRVERLAALPPGIGTRRSREAEDELRKVLADQGLAPAELIVAHRPLGEDAVALRRFERRAGLLPVGRPSEVLLAAIRPEAGRPWLVTRIFIPRGERALLASLIGQTLFIYLVLFGALALILRRISRPLAALAGRVERFAETRDAADQLEPEGPDDVRRLILAHNAMESRVAALLDEKDVMLGAIGHDLKTPLAALRVRIEGVEDAGERGKMAATIEDIARSLDDILSLARVGRPSDPREPVELAALVASVGEEFEDMGEPVELGETPRVVAPVRATWLRRALRNLISNALRYGGTARVSLAPEDGMAAIRIDDDGPGIPEHDLARMLEPFTRGDPSRNSETGGAGLGLTLARAIAEQHGGTLTLANRVEGGKVAGLSAVLRVPV